MTKVYGNLINRLEEGKGVPEIKKDMDITMYHWSDRSCYYITEVIDQKHIKVKKYEVVADRDKDCDIGHQNWKYFKTRKERNEYLNSSDQDPAEYPEEEWVYRRNRWTRAHKYSLDIIDSLKGNYFNWSIFTDKEYEKIQSGKEVTKYFPLEGKVSFGVRSYYHDWSF